MADKVPTIFEGLTIPLSLTTYSKYERGLATISKAHDDTTT